MKSLDNATVFKPWGFEYLFSGSSRGQYAGWVLHLNEGYHTSLHYHKTMNTVLYVISGKIKLEFKHGSTIIREGKKFIIYEGMPHRMIAIDDNAIVIELETPSNKLDSFRISDDWGRQFEGYDSGCLIVKH